ncbi:bacterio-opsin activator domain-containing protein [Haloarcula nitratireducens]|uniref:PAS domain S-box protein n=1 Tax=Haloarcula nitratireducens TaxID=2487749 RepID=A0AAW4PHG2_9EURY|nr:bacterio-opsin activator domain-containing protein [Halomicroarcula nitratireducens]MBX0296690.1 PAS domain S-box protein [Halomicroarcula nitratireducens]
MDVSLVLASSVALRVAGVGYSLALLYQSGDRRFGFLTVMLALMASRQVWTAMTGATTGLEELPGLAVSLLAVATVHYLSTYVEEEDRIKKRLREANEELRGFRKAVEHAGHAIFITDDEGTIEYANPAVESVTGYDPEAVVGEDPSLWKSDEHDESFYADLWGTITDGEVWDGEIINKHRDGDLRWVDMTIAPITDEAGEADRYVAVDTDVTERKERELRIRGQNERLERLNETNEVLREVNRRLVQADNREQVERATCEQFASTGSYDAAWVATRNMVNNAVRARTHAGIDDAELEQVVSAVNNTEETPVDRALAGSVTAVARTLDDGDPAPADSGATLAIPLTYRDVCYGALVVHAADADAVDVVDPQVLEELGETIAYAINAVESKRSLVADQVTELTFRMADGDGPLFSLAAALDCNLELERLSVGTDGQLVEYFTVTGTNADAVDDYVADSTDIVAAQAVTEHDDAVVFRFTVSESSVVATVAEQGCVVQSLSAGADGGRVTAELPQTADVRTVVEAVRNSHPNADLVAQQERERSTETPGEFRAGVEERLTDRQLEALKTAHLTGYFSWPRETSGEEVADLMDISQSTFLQHFRAAERKLFEAMFDWESVAGYRDTVNGSTSYS